MIMMITIAIAIAIAITITINLYFLVDVPPFSSWNRSGDSCDKLYKADFLLIG